MLGSLFIDPLFMRYAEKSPLATLTQMVLQRTVDAPTIDQIFEEHAEQQYHRSLLFSSLTSLVTGVVLGTHASMNAGYKKLKDELGVSITAVYEKLQRVEPTVTRQLVHTSYQQSVEICRAVGSVARHDLPGYATRILDGNWLSATDHRLKETRASTAAPLPGKSLVVYDPRFSAICDFFPMEDAYAQERSGLDNVIETLERRQLWLADRNFCTLKFMYNIAMKGGCFVIRLHNQVHGVEKGKLRKKGESETGVIYENKLVLPEFDGMQMTVRRVVAHLYTPTRDGDVVVVLLTNLPLKDADAVMVSELYRTRWKIEKAFLHMTMALNCEVKTLCYPKAALFCFACAIVAYNAFSILKGAMAAVHGRHESEMLSHDYLVMEIAEITGGMMIALPHSRWEEIKSMTIADFAAEVRSIISGMDLSRYRKSVRGPKNPPPERTHDPKVVHVSTKRLLDERQRQRDGTAS